MLRELEQNDEYQNSLYQAEAEVREEMKQLDRKDHEGYQTLHKKYFKKLANIRAKFLARFMLEDPNQRNKPNQNMLEYYSHLYQEMAGDQVEKEEIKEER